MGSPDRVKGAALTRRLTTRYITFGDSQQAAPIAPSRSLSDKAAASSQNGHEELCAGARDFDEFTLAAWAFADSQVGRGIPLAVADGSSSLQVNALAGVR